MSSDYLSLTSSLFEIYLTGLVAHVLQELACISPFGQMTYGTTTYQERRSVFCLFLPLRPPGLSAGPLSSIRASQLATGPTQLAPRPSQQAPKALPTGSRARALLACPETFPASYRALLAGSKALPASTEALSALSAGSRAFPAGSRALPAGSKPLPVLLCTIGH